MTRTDLATRGPIGLTFTAESEESWRATTIDGYSLRAGCQGGAAFSAGQLLLASLLACIAETVAPLCRRHGLGPDRVSFAARATPPDKAGPMDALIVIHLPREATHRLRQSVRRAAGKCPVARRLSDDVRLRIILDPEDSSA
ncbi:MAG: OsmC family protein [Gammaproteobacteria bacterium]|jgi:organic hydroperoxide reductase OsmC/OhrA